MKSILKNSNHFLFKR